MNFTVKKTAVKNPFSFWRLTSVRCFFMTLCAFVFVAHVSGFANTFSNEREEGNQNTHHLTHGVFFTHAPLGHHLTFGDIPAIIESEGIDEQSENKAEYHPPVTTSTRVVITTSLHTEKLLFTQLQHAHEGRNRISLIVLHHSWRSHLG
jgi:hypothetical protein